MVRRLNTFSGRHRTVDHTALYDKSIGSSESFAVEVIRGMACGRTLIGWGLAWVSAVVMAGPPYQTDDPEPVELHHGEFYIASQQALTADGRSGSLPHLEFNYGALPNLQLHLLVPYAFNTPEDGPSQRGRGDTELGVKYRFVQESDDTPMVGIFPLYLAPTGDQGRGLGNGASQFYLPIWLQKSWGPWTSYGGGGYWINHAQGARNSLFLGWQVQRDLSERWTLGAEVFHRTEQVVGQGSISGFNVGGQFNIDEHDHLLFSLGRGLQNAQATDRVSSYLGYQLTF
jgi:hypothetical protein